MTVQIALYGSLSSLSSHMKFGLPLCMPILPVVHIVSVLKLLFPRAGGCITGCICECVSFLLSPSRLVLPMLSLLSDDSHLW